MAKILVVDDHPDTRATLRGVLGDANHTVHAFGDPQLALEAAAQADPPFDVAVVDVRLFGDADTDRGGMLMATALRLSDPDLALILVTGYPLQVTDVVRAVRDLHAIDFIEKEPDWFGRLQATIEELGTQPRSMRGQVRRKLASFSVDEIQGICFDLGIDHESLPHATKDELARSLIIYCENRGWLDRLITLMRHLRPGLRFWPGGA